MPCTGLRYRAAGEGYRSAPVISRMKKVTLDTNVFPIEDLIPLANRNGYDCVVVTVTQRELMGSDIKTSLSQIYETGVYNESCYGHAVWGSKDDPFERVLHTISNGSFPKRGSRDPLSDGQRRQLRDAMIFGAHVREKRDIFVTNDLRAFVNNSRREVLEQSFGTSIMTRAEFLGFLLKLDAARAEQVPPQDRPPGGR